MRAIPFGPSALDAGAWRIGARGALIALAALLQASVIDLNFSFADAMGGGPAPAWALFNTALKHAAYAATFGGIVFLLMGLAGGRITPERWFEAARGHAWGRWFAGQCLLFAGLLAALPGLQDGAGPPPWLSFALWLCAGAGMLACAATALAPWRFWRAALAAPWADYVVALGAGLAVFASLGLAQSAWNDLSAATLHAAYALLSLYEPNAVIDPERLLIGASGFNVRIEGACSGYEGIGLVTTMLSFFVIAFRRHLRFPAVLILLPIGAVAIWLLNVVRIALLISLGAHVSPEVALGGFHAQAGWVMFLAASVALMIVAYSVFNVRRQARAHDPALVLAAALIASFAVLMIGRIGVAILGDAVIWARGLAMLAPLLMLLAYRRTVAAQLGRIGGEPVLIGLLVGGLWIATEPAGDHAPMAAWLAAQGPALAAVWLLFRVIGFTLVTPFAEELLFRGYLHRALAAPRFEDAPPAAFTWAAFVVTTVLFGAMHGRWLAGALAGAAFALALYRSQSLSGPIAAHVAANGVIAAYALTTESWALL